MIPSIAEELRRLERFLGTWGRPGAIIGGIAINARVAPRPTDDTDVLLVVPSGAQEELLRTLRQHGYAYDESETAALLEGGLVQAWGPPDRSAGMGLDILFADSPFTEAVIRRATAEEVLGAALPFAVESRRGCQLLGAAPSCCACQSRCRGSTFDQCTQSCAPGCTSSTAFEPRSSSD